MNGESRKTYCTGRQIILKTKILRTSLCDDSNAYIFLKGIVALTGTR